MDRLPNEILLSVMQYVPFDEISSLQLVNRTFYNVINKNVYVLYGKPHSFIDVKATKQGYDVLVHIRQTWSGIYGFQTHDIYVELNENQLYFLDHDDNYKPKKELANQLALYAGVEVIELSDNDCLLVNTPQYLEALSEMFHIIAKTTDIAELSLLVDGLPDKTSAKIWEGLKGGKLRTINLKGGPIPDEDLIMIAVNIDVDYLRIFDHRYRILNRSYDATVMDKLVPYVHQFQIKLIDPYRISSETVLQLIKDWQSGKIEKMNVKTKVIADMNYLQEVPKQCHSCHFKDGLGCGSMELSRHCDDTVLLVSSGLDSVSLSSYHDGHLTFHCNKRFSC